jgi:putative flippase GtrA
MALLTFRKLHKEAGRLSRFMLVGVSGTLLDLGLLLLLKQFGLATLFANTLSYSAGVLNNFSWNRLWTFRDARPGKWRQQLAQFAAVSLVGMGINTLLVLWLEAPLEGLAGHPGWGILLAKLFATGIVLFWNYFANRQWTFR